MGKCLQESAALGFNSDPKEEDSVNAFDWSAPSNVIQNDQLELKWSDDEEEAIESNGDQLKSVVKVTHPLLFTIYYVIISPSAITQK